MIATLPLVKIAVLGLRKGGECSQKRWQQHPIRGDVVCPVVVFLKRVDAVSVSNPHLVDVLKVHSLSHRGEPEHQAEHREYFKKKRFATLGYGCSYKVARRIQQVYDSLQPY